MRWLADQNLDNAIVRGLLRRNVAFEIVHARDVRLSRASDADLLAWAAQEDRILLTHDVSTVPPAAYERVDAAKPMPGVFAIPDQAAIGAVIEFILLVDERSKPGEWGGRFALCRDDSASLSS